MLLVLAASIIVGYQTSFIWGLATFLFGLGIISEIYFTTVYEDKVKDMAP